ncbi:MAG: hypothetical protein HKP58_20280 [Desulfatitalea sp.]|nr:hypothetical protein [Desulfatitalea sp.]NNK02756.1 hypothetical protein [Desulfatitalea sp.]
MPRVVVKIYDAVGGPAVPDMGGDGFKRGPTTPGDYVIAGSWAHKSHRYADGWSGVEWGSLLREHNGELQVKRKAVNLWEPLKKYCPKTKQEIMQYHFALYQEFKIPATWVFNDFGHITSYFFKDLNNNGRLDGSEKISGQMIHPTPGGEAMASKGLVIFLDESHGCIHVKPKDIDEMIQQSYLVKGNHIIVHPYTEPAPHEPIRIAMQPYEVHFYPRSSKMYIRGEKR